MDQPQDPSLSSNIISVSTHLYKRGCLSVGWSIVLLVMRFFYGGKRANNVWLTNPRTLTNHQTSTPLSPPPPPPSLQPLPPPPPPPSQWKPLNIGRFSHSRGKISLRDTLGPFSHYIINTTITTTTTTTTNRHCYTLWTHRWSRAGLVLINKCRKRDIRCVWPLRWRHFRYSRTYGHSRHFRVTGLT